MAALGFVFDPAPYRELTNAEVALALAERGVRVFPCRPDRPEIVLERGDDPDAKKPYAGVMWKGPEPGQIGSVQRWWNRWPDALPGIGLGDNRLLVVDADGGEEGAATWEDYAAHMGGLPPGTPVFDTPSGGRHYYFRMPEGVEHGNARGALPPKSELPVDIRGTNSGYVIAPGACRPVFGFYWPASGSDIFGWLDAPEIPAWLLTVLQGTRDRSEPTAERATALTIPAPPVPSDDPRIEAWVQGAFNDEITGLATCSKGSRNNQLNIAAFNLYQLVGGGFLADATVHAALMDATAACGLLRDDGPRQCEKTIASARVAGMASPRQVPANILEDRAAAELGAASAKALIEHRDGTLSDPETGEIIHDATAPPIAAVEAFPDHLADVPGLVGEMTDWIVATARRPNRVMALGAAITLVGTAMGRRIGGPTRAATHLYVLSLAITGAGKDHALQQIKRVLHQAEMKHLIGADDFTSMPAVIAMLNRAPLNLCPMDEFGGFLKRINGRRSSGFEQAITKTLRSLWGTNFNPFLTPEYAGKASQVIFAPAMSIYGASTPDEFFASLEGGDIVNGLLNRFLVLSVEGRPREVEPELPVDQVPESIIAAMKALYGGGNTLNQSGTSNHEAVIDPHTVGWADEPAKAIYAALTREVETLADNKPEAAPFVARTAEMAVRLATIRAVGRNKLKPAVAVDDIEWGRDVAMWSAKALMVSAGLYMAETPMQAEANRVLRMIREAGGKIDRRTLLGRLKHRMKTRDLDDLMKALEESGTIESALTRSTGSRGRAPRVYLLSR